MNILPLHENFTMPTRGSDTAGGFDIYMPQSGAIFSNVEVTVGLGFAAQVPAGHVALLLPRSGAGANKGISLRNTCGVIDADYRGEWKAVMSIDTIGNNRHVTHHEYEAGDRLLQFVIVPAHTPELVQVETLDETERGEGGFGSTGE